LEGGAGDDADLVKMKNEEDVVKETEDERHKKHAIEKEENRILLRKQNFPLMRYYLNCGFNLLIYGIGSKRDFINLFV
jgi:hypothetical protein